MNNSYLQAIWQITEQLRESDDLNDALSESLQIILTATNSEAGTIWMLNKNDDRLYPTFNVGTTDITGLSVENGQGIAGSVVKEGNSIIVEDCAKDPRFSSSVDEESGFVTKSMICVPIKSEHETLGCIQIINRKDGSLFGEDELRLAENMASLAAIAIEEKGFLLSEDKEREVLVQLVNVIKEFDNGGTISRVLKGINLSIYKGEFLVVLGESGCGKTTMMNIIGGMDYLTDGTLLVEGVDYSHPSDKELTAYRRNTVGFIFQNYNLMPNLSALDNVRFIAEISKDPMDPKEALDRVGLGEKTRSYPAQLSGGQQQRISIARAIVKNPKLILADEPTAALDYQTSIEVLQAIEEIVKKQNTTVIMITHNQEIGKMADRIVKLKGGKVYSIKRNAYPKKAAELEW